MLLCLAGAVFATERPAFAAGSCSTCGDITGRWCDGSWESRSTGHSGCLRAKIVRCGANHYQCTFCGSFCAIVPFRYTVTLHVTGRDEQGRTLFWAQKELPFGMGTFTCRGWATANQFCAGYASQDDTGTFVLGR